jgi:hypothetical protein
MEPKPKQNQEKHHGEISPHLILLRLVALAGIGVLGFIAMSLLEDVAVLARRIIGWILEQIRRIYFSDET